MKIEEIDKNFEIKTHLEEKDLSFFSVKENPFDLYGFCDKNFARLPVNIAENTNDGVKELRANTAGGRVRFKTNSPHIAVSVRYPSKNIFPHMPLSGVAGFDMYSKTDKGYEYIKTFIPPTDNNAEFEAIYYFAEAKMRDITINFPLYNNISEVYVGISKKSVLEHGGTYKNKKPIVYYGSSITQGGCASRPGNAYQAIISRNFDYDFINLGFSGSAKGEESIAEYIAGLDMSCFVMDYDHNAPDCKHLEKTHLPFYKIIRKANPTLDIILMSMTYCNLLSNTDKRREVIKATYDYAKSSKDNHIYFIDGSKIFDRFGGDSCVVDRTHPNDLGFMCMAQELIPIIKQLNIE